MQIPKKISAFTLIEVTIFLVIAGIIAGAIVTASQMVRTASQQNIIADLQHFTYVTQEFQDIYSSYPGDIPNFTDHIAGETDGDGNGYIGEDLNSNESLDAGEDVNTNLVLDMGETRQFWRHLYLTDLLPTAYDGSMDHTPGKAIPKGPGGGTGYRVRSDASIGILFDYSAYTTGNDDLPALTSRELRAIDNKVDDARPNSGIVRGFDASGVTAGDCVNAGSNSYNTATGDSLSCWLSYNAFPYIQNAVIADSTCGGVPVSSTRRSATETCPAGTTGTIIETCLQSGSWSITHRHCYPKLCLGGQAVGEVRTISCPEGYTGTQTQQCSLSGIWTLTNDFCVLDPNEACTNPDNRTLPCPVGFVGQVTQDCPTSTWNTTANTCAAITCAGAAIGDTIVGTGGSCAAANPNYTDDNGQELDKVCTIFGTAGGKTTSPQCAPDYTAALPPGPCTPGVTPDVNMGCRPGETGTYILECVGTGWQDKTYNCEPITCGGQPVGAFRVAEPPTECPSTIGVVIEICDEDGQWTLDESNCTV